MRILAIQPFLRGQLLNPAAGGKNKVALTLARRLAAEGHQLFLLPWKGERHAETFRVRLGDGGEQATVLPTLRIPEPATAGRVVRRLLVDRGLPLRPDQRLRAALKEELVGHHATLNAAIEVARPDLIHVHETHSNIGAEYRRLGWRLPILLTHHSPGVADGCDDYDYVVFVSRRQRRQALSRWPALEARSRVIYYFAEPEFYRPNRPRPSKDLIFVGNLDSDRKGLGLLIEAWAARPELNRLRLQVVGEGRDRERHQEQARAKGANLVFLGRRSAAEIADIESKSAAFVMPSRGEGLALTYLEALCMGLPILGFGANVEELTDLLEMPCGIVHDAVGDGVDELATRILHLVDSRAQFTVERRAQLQSRARRLFSQERFERDYLDLYQALRAGAGEHAS